MKTFSERQGLIQPRQELQLESMDGALRNGLWNALTKHYWEMAQIGSFGYLDKRQCRRLYVLIEHIWADFFKAVVDEIPHKWADIHRSLKQTYFSFSWNKVYDFVEFVPLFYPDQPYEHKAEAFQSDCNLLFDSELSGYRFIGDKVVPITSSHEIETIETAIESTMNLKPVNFHIHEALRLWSDRNGPDYRNAIKEAISAVEALCGVITATPHASLGDALNMIEKNKAVDLHGALKSAFQKLYGYSSNAQGIRHALLDEPSLESEDAKFIIIACSAFINYLIVKAGRAGISW